MEMLGEARYEEILKEVENIPLEYDKENTKQYDLLLNRILNGSDGMIGDSFLTEEEKESIGKRMT